MASANITDILKRPATDFEAPKPLPAAAYHCVVQGLPEQGESSKKKTPFFRFPLTPISMLDGDAQQTADLEAAGGLDGRTINADFYITENSVYRLREFLEHCGIESDGRSLEEMIDDVPNREVIAFIAHEPSRREGDERVFARFNASAPVG